MNDIINQVKELLLKKDIGMFIGYTSGYAGSTRPIFITHPDDASRLVYNENCRQNLVAYIHKPEVKKHGKIGIFANDSGLRSILQLASEHQISDGDLVVLTITDDGQGVIFDHLADIEHFLAGKIFDIKPQAKEKIDKLLQMDLNSRWEWWTKELSNCIKCYACRSACPMCYCTQCTVECNNPQWVPTSSHALGNVEWHILRAMHLAGRCVSCGECMRACPVDIPLGLLTEFLNGEVKTMFDAQAGLKAKADYALSTFKNEDKENFIR